MNNNIPSTLSWTVGNKLNCQSSLLLLSEVFVGVSKVSDYPVQLLTPCSGVRKDWAKLPVEILQVRVEIVGH